MNDKQTNYPNFPYDWDIDSPQQLNYYYKCFPYIQKDTDFDNIIHKSKIFYTFGILSILYFIILSLMLIKHREHFIFKRQGRVYFLLFLLGSILSSINSFIAQVFIISF